jgi:hypothetical protein
MNNYEIFGATLVSSTIVIPALLYLFKTIIKEFLTNAIKHDYDIKIEELKSKLAQNGNDVRNLREGALNGVYYRQSKLYDKQIQAVESLWSDVIELSKTKSFSTCLLSLSDDFSDIANKAKDDDKVRKLFETLEGNFKIEGINFLIGEKLRPFLSPLSWAYYKAYKSILAYDFIKFNIIKFGVGEEVLEENTKLKKLIEIALPDKKDYIYDKTTNSFYYLLEILENRLLDELKIFLKGTESTKESIDLASSIMNQVEELEKNKNK